LAAVPARFARAIEARERGIHGVLEAGGQQTVLVREVVIERGLRDAEACRDLVHRGRVIALEIERGRGFPQHLEALDPVHIFPGGKQTDLPILPGTTLAVSLPSDKSVY